VVSKEKEFEKFKEFKNRSQESGARIQEVHSDMPSPTFFEKVFPGARSASAARSS
jgi:hypothetical protein